MPSAAGEPAAPPRVGVLSLQGDFERHRATLEALGVTPVRVTLPQDLEGLEALILPGGESTTMLRLLEATGLREPIERFVRERPVMGTCAGLILLGREVPGLPSATLGVIDAEVHRNAYGRQIDSFSAPVESPLFEGRLPGVFIRAPRIRRVGPGVEVVARLAAEDGSPKHVAGEPVGLRSGRAVGLCFHPELTPDLSFHRWFLSEVAGLRLAVPEPAARRASEAGA